MNQEIYSIICNPNKFAKKKYQAKNICEALVKYSGYFIQYIKEENRTMKICRIALNKDYASLQYMNQTNEIIDMALSINIRAFYYIIDKTYDICIKTVKLNGIALSHVPFEMRTIKMCRLAVSNNGFAIQFVPKQTEKLCLLAVTNNGFAIEYVQNQTIKLCLLAIRFCPICILYIRNPNIELCNFALKLCPDLYEDVAPILLYNIKSRD